MYNAEGTLSNVYILYAVYSYAIGKKISEYMRERKLRNVIEPPIEFMTNDFLFFFFFFLGVLQLIDRTWRNIDRLWFQIRIVFVEWNYLNEPQMLQNFCVPDIANWDSRCWNQFLEYRRYGGWWCTPVFCCCCRLWCWSSSYCYRTSRYCCSEECVTFRSSLFDKLNRRFLEIVPL